jgi:hypothetical protein
MYELRLGGAAVYVLVMIHDDGMVTGGNTASTRFRGCQWFGTGVTEDTTGHTIMMHLFLCSHLARRLNLSL